MSKEMSVINEQPIFDAFRTLTGPISHENFALIKSAISELNAGNSDKALFVAYGQMDDDDKISSHEFAFIKRAVAAALANDNELSVIVSDSRDMSRLAIESLKKTEGYRLQAYPDPGSKDGHPWTIGYGATGAGIRRGVKWSKAQADARLVSDIRRFEDQVEKILGETKVNQHQFDAMVHFAYNVGTRAFSSSTLLKKHRRGDFVGAANEFKRWNKNDGKVMKGLTNRRKIEENMYNGIYH